MKQLTFRQGIDVVDSIKTELSWGVFKEYIETTAKEKRTLAKTFTSLMQILEREQLLGQADLLDELLSDFQNHVKHNVVKPETDKEQ